jgi:secreted trypsin-like serine protease
MRSSRFCSHVSLAVLLSTGGCLEQGAELGDAQESAQGREIVGGTATQISATPWQVSLQSAQGQHFCGGSILSATWIVTAAHCVAEGAPARILAGASKLSEAATGQARAVKRVISYPGYADASLGKDAALLELTTPLDLNGTTVRAVRPVTTADAAALTSAGVLATVSGWGTLTEGATTAPDQLQSVQVPIVSLDDARADYAMTISPDQLAAGLRGVGGKDSCQGDSGGPLVVANGAIMMLAGIVSWGDGCARANAPGMYARVTSFAKWMDSYVGGPPVAAAGPDMSVKPGTSVQIDGSTSTDAGFGLIASYRWQQVAGTPVTLQDATAKMTSFLAPDATGSFEFELTVTDEQGTVATDRVVIAVSKNAGAGSTDAESQDTATGGCSSSSGVPGLALGLLAVLGVLVPSRRRVAR